MPIRSSIASQTTFVGMTSGVLNNTMLAGVGVKAFFRKQGNLGSAESGIP